MLMDIQHRALVNVIGHGGGKKYPINATEKDLYQSLPY